MTKKPEQPKENNLAVASLVLGIVSVVGFGGALTGIPAIITGFMSLKNPTNKNLGIIGIVLGSLATLLTLLVVALFVFLFIFAAANSDGNIPETTQPDFDTPYSEHRT